MRSTSRCVAIAAALSTAILLCGSAQAATLHTLYSFCPAKGCADGMQPGTGLLMDSSGNLFGTTSDGGAHGQGGTIFELSPKGGQWKRSVLYSFCAQRKCADGATPSSRLIVDGAGDLYGTTENGGTNGDPSSGGTVFKLSRPAGHGAWALQTLHSFCSEGGKKSPQSGMVLDQSGNLFGMTFRGATGDDPGVAFELSPTKKGAWKESVLHAFCSDGACLDGANPQGSLVMDSAGNLFGTASEGGSGAAICGSEFEALGCGVVFKLVPGGKQSEQQVLYSFCPQQDCADGDTPSEGLILDSDGNLYGTTLFGGAQDHGTVFKISGGGEQVL